MESIEFKFVLQGITESLNNSYEIETPRGFQWGNDGNWYQLSDLPGGGFEGSGKAYLRCSPLAVRDAVVEQEYVVSALFPDGQRREVYKPMKGNLAFAAMQQGKHDNRELSGWKMTLPVST